MHRIPNDPGNQGSGWLFQIKPCWVDARPLPLGLAFRDRTFWASGQSGQTGPPLMGPTQHPIPGVPPSPRPAAPSLAWTHSALPAEGISVLRRHSPDPGLAAPADFPWREEHNLLRKWGPGQQAASEQPCPALPGVQSCHGLWVSVGCPGLGGGGLGAWRGSSTPSPDSSSARAPAGGAPGMGLPMMHHQAFHVLSILESVRSPPEHSASSGPR